MGNLKWILVAGALLALLSGQMMAGPGSDTRVFFDEDTTTNSSAVLMGFAANIAGSATTSLAVSNTMGAPDLMGMPEGGDTHGAVWLFCYNTLPVPAPAPTSVSASSHLTPPIPPVIVDTGGFTATVGSGLTDDGELVAGATWLVFLSEALEAADYTADFVGYCYVVGKFDAIAGFNISTIDGGSVGLAMTSDFVGVATDIDDATPPGPTPK